MTIIVSESQSQNVFILGRYWYLGSEMYEVVFWDWVSTRTELFQKILSSVYIIGLPL